MMIYESSVKQCMMVILMMVSGVGQTSASS